MYRHFLKRVFDFLLSLIAIIVLSPVLVIISLFVRVKLGSPVIYKQRRPGYNRKIFTIYKFRSMTNKKDSNGNLLPDAERLTKFGIFLRSTSLDELPELINILKGDMALVGPRPLLPEYLPLYNSEQNKRHSVRPGLTGLAQVNGRNAISWEQKFAYDIEYINKCSLVLDLMILFRTFVNVIHRHGISSESDSTNKPFLGNKNLLK